MIDKAFSDFVTDHEVKGLHRRAGLRHPQHAHPHLRPETARLYRAAGPAIFRQLLERAPALPGVNAAGLASILPLGWGTNSREVVVDGQPPQPDGVRWWLITTSSPPAIFG